MRTAKRKALAKANKRTPKSKQSEVESSTLADEKTTLSEFESKTEESTQLEETVVTELGDESVAAQPVVGMVEIKLEIESITNENSDQDGKLTCGGSSSSAVKEELVEGEKDTDNVMVPHNTEKSLGMEVEIHTCDENIIVTEEKDENASDEKESSSCNDGFHSEIVPGTDTVTEDHNTEEIVEMEVENHKKCEENIIITENKGENVPGESEGAGGNDGLQLPSVPVAEFHSAEEENVAVQINIDEAFGDDDNPVVVHEGSNEKGEAGDYGEDEGHDKNSDYNKDDENPCVSTHDLLTDRSKEKNIDIFIGRLDNEVVEDDLVKVFGTFGEITSTRIIRNTTSKKSKGFAFIQYATNEQAKTALSKLKDGLEVRGKRVKVSARQDKHTLYVGNICKTWTKELVLEMLKHYGIDKMEEIHVPDYPKKVGRIKGFALLEFSTHSDAMAALQRLGKPDAVFGRDISAKVAFAQPPLHPSEKLLSQINRVYIEIEGITDAWNEEKVKEICKQYGEIVEFQLCQYPDGKRKCFGFITFSSQESTLACVDGINNAQTLEGEVKIKASIAKPQNKGGLQKQGFRGVFKVKQINEVSPSKKGNEMSKQSSSLSGKGLSQSKRRKRKGKAKVEEKGETLSESRIVDGGKLDKARSCTGGRSAEPTSKLERTNNKRKTISTKVEDRGIGGGGIEHGDSKRPSKKARGNTRGRAINNNRNIKRDPHVRKWPDYGAHYALENDATTAYYKGHGRSSISAAIRRNTDMEPHAGYIIPTAVKQGQPNMGYFDPAVRTKVQPHAGYQPTAGTRGQPYVGYLEPDVGFQGRHVRYVDVETSVSVIGQTHGGYLEPAVPTYGQPHAGYVQPAVAEHGHDLYDPRWGRRVGGPDGQGSRDYDYGGAGSSLPLSYAPSYSRYARYEGSSAGGYYYQRGAAYPPGRAYRQTKY